MPWVKKIPKPHACKKPGFHASFNMAVRSQWRCRKCSTTWEITAKYSDWLEWKRVL